MAGELGHVLVEPEGAVCRCGNRGCLETAASTGALLELLRRSHGELTVAEMLRLAHEGDLGCRRVIADAGRVVGSAAAFVFNVLNPQRLVVGGDLAEAGDLLLDGVRSSLRLAALPAAADGASVVAGVLGERAQVLGALALAVGEAGAALDIHESINQTIPGGGVFMKKGAVWLAIATVAASLAVAGCGDDEDEGGGGSGASTEESGGEVGKVAVLLPDSKSSVRWETVDRPFLQEAFEAAGVEAEIQNAEGDKATQQQQAEQAITNGAKVILLVNLDSGSGAAIEAANAAAQDVKVIDYDRLTLNSTRRRLLRLVRQREGRQAPGRGPRRLHGRQDAR